MVTLRRESSQLSQSLPVCFMSSFTENNTVQEIRFYKTEDFSENKVQAKHAIVRSQEKKNHLRSQGKKGHLRSHQNMKIIFNLQKCQAKDVSQK